MRALLVVALAACGFAPEDDLTGRRIGDGVATWQDLGPAELCLGVNRIGPAGSRVGGLCEPISSPAPVACLADDDCASRERCVCGRCTVQFCTSNGECGPDRVCTFAENRCDTPCATGADCAAGEGCVSGVCRRGCEVTDDCQTGEVCATQGNARRCIVADCADDDDCLASESCAVQREPRAAFEPTVLAEGVGFSMWLEMDDRTAGDRAIFRLTSRDGVRWRFDPAEAVLENGGDAHAPSVIRTDAGYRLFFRTAAGIAVADSPDGVAFDAPTSFLSGDWHAPAAAVVGGEVLVWVASAARGGLFLSRDGAPPSSVLAPGAVVDEEHWRDVTQVGSPFVLVEASPLGEPTVRLWFDAFGEESGVSMQFGEPVQLPPNDSLGFASAPAADPAAVTVWAYNPIFDRVVAFLEHRAERAPAVVRVPGEETYFLYYEGWSADGAESDGLGVAVNPPAASE